MIPNFTVVYDACVLYPNTLRDLLMELAVRDLYRAKWTEDIHDEWIRNLTKKFQMLRCDRKTLYESDCDKDDKLLLVSNQQSDRASYT